MNRIILLIGGIGFISILTFLFLPTPAPIGKPLDIKFTAVDGSSVDLAQFRGKVVLVDFWATWCGSCRGEVPYELAAYQKFHKQGFEIIGISLDQDKSSLLRFIKQNGMSWPQYFDGKVWNNSVSSSYGISSLPAMWLVNKQGILVGVNGDDNLEDQVQRLLKSTP